MLILSIIMGLSILQTENLWLKYINFSDLFGQQMSTFVFIDESVLSYFFSRIFNYCIKCIKTSCNMNAFFSFDLFMVYLLKCKQQLRTMTYYTQIRDIAHFKSGL